MDSIDDVEEMQIMDEAFDILGFKLEEKVITFSFNINMAARASNAAVHTLCQQNLGGSANIVNIH